VAKGKVRTGKGPYSSSSISERSLKDLASSSRLGRSHKVTVQPTIRRDSARVPPFTGHHKGSARNIIPSSYNPFKGHAFLRFYLYALLLLPLFRYWEGASCLACKYSKVEKSFNITTKSFNIITCSLYEDSFPFTNQRFASGGRSTKSFPLTSDTQDFQGTCFPSLLPLCVNIIAAVLLLRRRQLPRLQILQGREVVQHHYEVVQPHHAQPLRG
jgi:hypothetical protein